MRETVKGIVEGALDGRRLRLREVERLLTLESPDEAQLLFAAAREMRTRHFGSKIFLYGFVYFSTHCRNQCAFCFYRRGNKESPRYRKSPGEVVQVAEELAASGVHLVDLTMGEDPSLHGRDDYSSLVELVRQVREAAEVPVMVSPGVVPRHVLSELRQAGTDWYACYQETHTPELYATLRPNQDFLARAAARSNALAVGLYAEDGILLGVGESAGDRARSLLTMKAQGVQQVRVMGFVPQRGTPMSGRALPSLLAELVTLATMRLVMPDRLIPASLDIDGLRGLETRLLAGANVVTSIIPPASGMAGVAQSTLDIGEGFRTVDGVRRHLGPLGLTVADQTEYEAWLHQARAAEPCALPS